MPSILSSSALLVDFSASQWTARKIDKRVSADLTETHKAKEKSAHVSKKLIQADSLQAINTLVTQARDFHKANTLPWLDNGSRILPAKRHHPYMSGMEKFEEQFWPMVRTFVANYPRYIEDAARQHTALGLLFDPNDYPKATRIEGKFAWRVTPTPLPDASDFRVDIGQSAIDRVKAQITDSVNNAASNAVRDCFERAHDAVARMVESLNAFDPTKSGKERGTFRDTMVTNIRDLADILPDLNFTNDTRISQLAISLRDLTSVDAETMRASDNIRAGVAAKAMEIVQAVSDFMA